MNLKSVALFMLAVVFGGLTTQASAHHGTAVNYDRNKIITITGTVSRFVWRNPHSALILDVNTESGKVISHAIELPSPVGLVELYGWNRRTLKPGDVVKVNVIRPGRERRSPLPFGAARVT